MKVAAVGLLLALVACSSSEPRLRVGSKKFTESVILGEAVAQLFEDAGFRAEHVAELGGTRIVFEALVQGELDAYVEYTGTLHEEVFAGRDLDGDAGLAAALAERGLRMSAPLGFENTYALGMLDERAAELGIETVSDLRDHPDLRLGFTAEFVDRGDGWPGLAARYRLPHDPPRGLDHDLAYRGLAVGDFAVTDLYTTDAEIEYYGLRVLDDDLAYFPEYRAVVLYRADLPAAAAVSLLRLEGSLDEPTMSSLNRRAKIDGRHEAVVAAAFLRSAFGVESEVSIPGLASRLLRTTAEHLFLVALSLAAAIAVGLPLGIFAAGRPRAGRVVLGTVGVLQTIPSFALFVFLIPVLGLEEEPAIVGLFLYSLLPIVRGAHAGLVGVPPELSDSALALGLSPRARLRLVELPLAMRSILSGIQTSAVINVGTATIAAIVGAGGYGAPILRGIRRDDYGTILEGAIPAALLALAVQWLFDLLERALVSPGLSMGANDEL